MFRIDFIKLIYSAVLKKFASNFAGDNGPQVKKHNADPGAAQAIAQAAIAK